MFSMILDKVYFFWAGTQEAPAGAMWFDSRWISASYRLLLTTLEATCILAEVSYHLMNSELKPRVGTKSWNQ